ncbi:hypothetical protein AB0M39_16315 [Streptomyces sp. NPDC051907]|uniref:hypothetical protein n=1 Tax=Streptomyces sp. NPDC051907 TaxID=3155284 RepID=UPI003433C29A
MAAHTQTPTHAKVSGGVETRLPWWGVALPMIAFVALLLLIADPAQAHAAGGDPALGQLLERVQQTLAR